MAKNLAGIARANGSIYPAAVNANSKAARPANGLIDLDRGNMSARSAGIGI